MLNVSYNILMAIVKTETELHSFIHVSHNQVKQYSKSIHSINIIYMQVSKFTTFWTNVLLFVPFSSNLDGFLKILPFLFFLNFSWP